MRSSRQTRYVALSLIAAVWLPASTAEAQTLVTSAIEPGESRADVAVGVTFEAPRDVNQMPLCGELFIPCLSPRTLPDLGATLSVAAHLGDHVAVIGEAAASRNVWYAEICGVRPFASTDS